MLFHINIFITKLEKSIEHYFSMMKARLRKIEGLTHTEIKQNISIVIEIFQNKNNYLYII
jgi:hypothetical protein